MTIDDLPPQIDPANELQVDWIKGEGQVSGFTLNFDIQILF